MNATALTYKLDASNKRILDVSRDALLRIFTCAYAYRMTGDAKYLTKAETDINAVCNFPDCNSKRHILDVGERIVEVCLPTGTEQELEPQLLRSHQQLEPGLQWRAGLCGTGFL